MLQTFPDTFFYNFLLTYIQTTCSDGIDSYGRKKRAIAKRQAEENDVEDISVGSSISISTEEVIIESK